MSSTPTFTPLRLAHGNLHIRIDTDPAHDMLLDREVIAANCTTLEPILREPEHPSFRACWDRSKMIKVSGEDEPMRIWYLALNLIDGAYLLEGSRVEQIEKKQDFSKVFHTSCLFDPDWKTISMLSSDFYETGSRGRAAFQLHVMFQILHGQQVRLEELRSTLSTDRTYEQYEFGGTMLLSGWLSELCAQAEYYGSLPKVVKSVIGWLTEDTMLWQAVAVRPDVFIILGMKLRWAELYFDAFRRYLDQPRPFRSLKPIAKLLEVDLKDLEELQASRIAEQDEVLTNLKSRLRELQLPFLKTKVAADQSGGARTTTVRKMELLEYETVKPSTPSDEKYSHLARSIYGEWLAAEEVGREIYSEVSGIPGNTMASAFATPFAYTIAKMRQYATSQTPAALFGATAAEKHLDLLGMDRSEASVEATNDSLVDIVKQANEVVQKSFQRRTRLEEDGTTSTFREANWTGKIAIRYKPYRFTFLGLDEDDVPWKLLAEWDCKLEVGQRSSKPASMQLLQALDMIIGRDLLDPEDDLYENGILRELFEEETDNAVN